MAMMRPGRFADVDLLLLYRFAWTSYPSVHWIVPIIGSSLFGAGIYIVILAVLNYVVDSYGSYCASALAGVILARNIVGAGFPLFARQMYTTLGNEWASSLLGFLSLLFVPIPIWWFYRGEQLRLKSPWARYVIFQFASYRIHDGELTAISGSISTRTKIRRISNHPAGGPVTRYGESFKLSTERCMTAAWTHRTPTCSRVPTDNHANYMRVIDLLDFVRTDLMR